MSLKNPDAKKLKRNVFTTIFFMAPTLLSHFFYFAIFDCFRYAVLKRWEVSWASDCEFNEKSYSRPSVYSEQSLFETFQFLLFFSSICNFFSFLRGPIQFRLTQKNKVSNDIMSELKPNYIQMRPQVKFTKLSV